MKIKLLALTLVSTIALSGCGTPHISNEYLSANHQHIKYFSANVRCNGGEYNQKLEAYIRTYLQKENIQLGDDLLISCQFVRFNPENRAARWLIGFGAGSAYSDINIELLNRSNVTVRSFRVKADLSVGVFGGSVENMIQSSAKEIVDRIKPMIDKTHAQKTTSEYVLEPTHFNRDRVNRDRIDEL